MVLVRIIKLLLTYSVFLVQSYAVHATTRSYQRLPHSRTRFTNIAFCKPCNGFLLKFGSIFGMWIAAGYTIIIQTMNLSHPITQTLVKY